MTTSHLNIKVEGGVARVFLSRPDVHNAFDPALIEELTRTFTWLSNDSEIRVVVLGGEGKHFCAGADIQWMKSTVEFSEAENRADAERLHDMLESIYRCRKPVIARIQGAAFGGGVGLLSAADIAVVAEDATICLSEVKLGILPAVIGSFVTRKVGSAGLRAYGLSAKKMTGAEALRVGFAHEVVPATDLDAAVDRWVHLFLENGPEAMALLKDLSEEIRLLPMAEAKKRTTSTIAKTRTGAEGQEGLKAFLEKRPPTWRKLKDS